MAWDASTGPFPIRSGVAFEGPIPRLISFGLRFPCPLVTHSIVEGHCVEESCLGNWERSKRKKTWMGGLTERKWDGRVAQVRKAPPTERTSGDCCWGPSLPLMRLT